ncbi:Uncharacterized protein Fot_06743 [Forsythia ovata]|uniref:Uncharacterized protein n=1 Tax=Forsythia ovata TaxID=205694 RepID=A0ABD1WTT8_9LAMI
MENNMQEGIKKAKVMKEWLAVRVGLEDEDGGFQRFVIPISYLYHPLFKKLLDIAREVDQNQWNGGGYYGYAPGYETYGYARAVHNPFTQMQLIAQVDKLCKINGLISTL